MTRLTAPPLTAPLVTPAPVSSALSSPPVPAERASQAPQAPQPSQAPEVSQAPEAPLFHLALRLEGQRCLVVGGGPVAARKASALLACGAVVTVVAPEICRAVEELPVAIERRPYRPGEAAAYRVVMAATGEASVDEGVFLDGEAAGVLVNAADDPASCSFLMPAVLRRGPVSVAVSTGGASPFLAAWVRSRIGALLEPEVGDLATVVGEARAAVRAGGGSTQGLGWSDLVEHTLWPLVRAGEMAVARSAAARWASDALAARSGRSGVDGTLTRD